MAKGNRTHVNRDITAANGMCNEFVRELDSYKQLAEKRRAQRILRQEDAMSVLGKMTNYIEECKASNKPMTISGLNLAVGVTSKVFSCARKGDYDYYLDEYMELNGYTDDDIEYRDGMPFIGDVLIVPYSELMDYAVLMIQEQREMACSSLRGNPAGNIFLLKAQNGLREEESPQTVNQTLVIADSNKALEAMKLLGD